MRGVDVSGDLVEFAFESQAAEDLTAACIARLVRRSWSFNVRKDLTGELRLRDGRFVQVIEGRCADILMLAARIIADSRHGAIRILALRGIEARRFAGWTVSGLDLADHQDETPRPSAANLHFMQARAAARLIEVGRPAS